MKGYHNLPEETAEVMTDDGGFRTGDLGRIDDDGFLYITGRIKEQYKLENGKYVVPAPLEEQLQLSPYVVQVFIYGDNKPFNVALVVPDRPAVEKWAREHGVGRRLRGDPRAPQDPRSCSTPSSRSTARTSSATSSRGSSSSWRRSSRSTTGC